jgi:hypothetical protein
MFEKEIILEEQLAARCLLQCSPARNLPANAGPLDVQAFKVKVSEVKASQLVRFGVRDIAGPTHASVACLVGLRHRFNQPRICSSHVLRLRRGSVLQRRRVGYDGNGSHPRHLVDHHSQASSCSELTGAKRRKPWESPADCAYRDETGRYPFGDPAQGRTGSRRSWVRQLQPELASLSTHGKQIVVDSGHEMPTEHSEVVISAIHEVWLAAR